MVIFEQLSDIIRLAGCKKTDTQLARMFNRERKWILEKRNSCNGFMVNTDFICGLRALGYDIKIIKIKDD